MTKGSETRLAGNSLALIGLLALGSGCGEEESPDGLEVGDPRYALGVQIVDATTFETTLYVVFTDDIDSGSVDLSNALEAGGTGNMHALPGQREFFISSRERSDLAKYRIEDGFVREVGRVLLSGLGVQLFGEAMIFDGPDRGFLFDMLSSQIVELDLEAMEILDSIDASALVDPSQPTFLAQSEVVQRGDEIIMATYGTDLQQETVSELSRIVFFDLETQALEGRTAPCGGLTMLRGVENGDVYFFSDPWVAGVHGISTAQGPAPCMVRLPAGSRDPDPTPVMLNSLTSRPTGGLVPAGDGSVYLRVLDTKNFPITNDTTASQLFGVRGWETFEVDLTQPTSAAPASRDGLATGGITYFDVDGTVYENQSSDDFGSTLMLRTTGPGAPAPAIRTPGIVFEILRLR